MARRMIRAEERASAKARRPGQDNDPEAQLHFAGAGAAVRAQVCQERWVKPGSPGRGQVWGLRCWERGLHGACSPQNTEDGANQQAQPQAQGQSVAAHGWA